MNKSPQPPFCLLETMRWEHGIALLHQHLSRSESASATLGFAFNEAAILDALQHHEKLLDSDSSHRVRLTLDKNGSIELTSSPIDSNAKAFRKIAVYPEPVDWTKDLRAFKTTNRSDYEAVYNLAKQRDLDEAILINERGEIVEGTRTNVWVRRNSEWLTPPLSSGCLGGVYRAHMLETRNDTSEAILTVDDLMDADEIGLSNAVHGFVLVNVDRW